MTDHHTDHHKVTIADVMSTVLIGIDPMASIREAADLMHRHNLSSLVVNRRDPSDEYGILTVRDIARDVIGKNLSAERVQVYEAMTKPVLSLPSGMTLPNAVQILTRFRLTRALVIEADREPAGIVTLRDMVIRGMSGAGKA